MIPLYRPYMPAQLPELEAILHSGSLSYGKWGKLFEAHLAEYLGEHRIATTGSYNHAVLIALTAIGVKPGDEIIASPLSCLASNQPFATQGLKVVWADIDPQTGTLCPDRIKAKLSTRTKAIFHNHHCGYPGYIDEINEIGRDNGIIVVDDAIEAFGSEYKGKRLGSCGTDLTMFSFQTVRLPNTLEGGAIAFGNDDLYKKSLLIRDYGVDRTIFRDELGEISPACDISLPGFGATLNEVSSYIGVIQMQVIDELLQQQRANAEHWRQVLEQRFPGCEPVSSGPDRRPNFWVFGLLSSNQLGFLKEARAAGYFASKVHLPNNRYSIFGGQPVLAGVEEFYSKFVAVPSGWWVSFPQADTNA